MYATASRMSVSFRRSWAEVAMTRKDRYRTLAVGRGIPSNESYLFEIILVS